MKSILISGIQPTGKLHIGNYLGALKNFVELQNSRKYECYFFIADLHALTENPSRDDLQNNIQNLELDFLSAGLNPQKSCLFIQSQVPAHAELASILNTLTPVSELMRMTAFKEKVLQLVKLKEGHELARKEFDAVVEKSNFGLADYPVLMTADIILYNAKFVPVGNDQDQHLELARTLVRKFNAKFGKTFIEPNPLHTDVPRLMSLDDPIKKMSKSRPEGCLFLDDEPSVIRKKILSATTDSGRDIRADIEGKPGITNLLLLYSSFSGKSIHDIEKQYAKKGYAEFKKDLAEVVIKALEKFQKTKRKLLRNPEKTRKIFYAGCNAANKKASDKFLEVKRKIGLA